MKNRGRPRALNKCASRCGAYKVMRRERGQGMLSAAAAAGSIAQELKSRRGVYAACARPQSGKFGHRPG